MPAYNFQPRFAALVEGGQKRQTIRRTAKCATRGSTAHLYTGQRTANCRKLGEGTITDVLPIEIGRHACSEPYACLTDGDGQTTHLVHEHLDSLAREDGFANGEEMTAWFAAQYGLPFTGYLHRWVPSNTVAATFVLSGVVQENDAACIRCRGDGMDPYNDYLLPCPECGGRFAP